MELLLKKYNKQHVNDNFHISELWSEYESFFSLKKEQPEYYYGEFLDELRRLQSSASEANFLYLLYVYGVKRPIGMFQLVPSESNMSCELKKFLITKNFRNKGLGKLAITQMLQEARIQGYTKCILDVLITDSKAAHQVYLSNGFRMVRATSFKNKNDVLWMECPL